MKGMNKVLLLNDDQIYTPKLKIFNFNPDFCGVSKPWSLLYMS